MVVLPAPLGPSRPNTSPARDVEVERVDGAGRAVRLAECGDGDGGVGGGDRSGVPPRDVRGELVEPGARRRRERRRGERGRATRRRAARSPPRPRRARRCARRRSWSAATSAAVRSGAPRRPSSSRSARVGAGARDRDERRRLALAQVVADRLAGDLGVAERAEDVVAELERLAQRQADGRERGRELGERARERGAEVQRPLDRVLARLVDRDAAGGARRRCARSRCRRGRATGRRTARRAARRRSSCAASGAPRRSTSA